MSEQLSSDDNRQAERLYENHRNYNYNIKNAVDNEEYRKAFAPLLSDYDPKELYEIQIKGTKRNPDRQVMTHVMPQAEIKQKRELAQMALQANLWEAREHKEAHLGEYIETARQEAEADGKQINLQPPTEQQ